ncbi:MAG: DUF1600 domain-containing protein [Mycoplasma sp.]
MNMHKHDIKNVDLTKISIVTSIQTFVLMAFLISLVFAIKSFLKYDWSYVISAEPKMLPQFDEAVRMWMLYSGSIYLSLSIYLLVICLKNEYPIKDLKFTFGIFMPLLFVYLWFLVIKLRAYKDFNNYITKRNYSIVRRIDHKTFFLGIIGKGRINKVWFVTFFSYLTLATFIAGILLTGIPAISFDNAAHGLIKNFLSFFTILTNIYCMFVVFIYMFMHDKKIFKFNRLLHSCCAYIIIVASVYWGYLFPLELKTIINDPYAFADRTLLHGVTPIMFITFSLFMFRDEYEIGMRQAALISLKGLSYPATYGIYAYLIPFIIKWSVYGDVTNVNGFIITANGEAYNIIFGVIGFIWLFLSFYFLQLFLFLIANLISKNNFEKDVD